MQIKNISLHSSFNIVNIMETTYQVSAESFRSHNQKLA